MDSWQECERSSREAHEALVQQYYANKERDRELLTRYSYYRTLSSPKEDVPANTPI